MYRRASALIAGMAVAVAVNVAPASAAVATTATVTAPTAVTVGQSNSPASFTLINTNTAPDEGSSQTLTSLRIAPSCGASSTVTTPCDPSFADPGVFGLSVPAIGGPGACFGKNFNFSVPDANGVVTLTPTGGAAVLGPPDGAPGGPDQCSASFSFNTLKLPTRDASPPDAGLQTSFNLTAQTNVSTAIASQLVTVSDPDSDGDGIGNSVDACPTQAGPASNNGCPVSGGGASGGASAACADAEKALKKAAAKVQKLKQQDASHGKIKRAKEKKQDAKADVRGAC